MPTREIKAFLLDLDDTLLINDMETFFPHYLRMLVDHVRGVCPPVTFMAALDAGVRAMWHNDGKQHTNAEAFRDAFFSEADCPRVEMEELLQRFYTQEFESLSTYTQQDPAARELIELLQSHDYSIAIATQPVFPLPAIEARLRWADVGVESFDYDFVASYEKMKACKPRSAYFHTILQHMGNKPSEAIMVGDSPESDMPARRLGMRTFWVDRGRLPEKTTVPCNAQGDLSDLIHLVETGAIHEL